MGLSLRDLQEALYFLKGHVLTLIVQNQLDIRRLAPLANIPEILIGDRVWVEIQYTRDELKQDRSGYLRQCRQAEEQVVLAVLAVWEDDYYEMPHYEVATEDGEEQWSQLFEHLIERDWTRKRAISGQ